MTKNGISAKGAILAWLVCAVAVADSLGTDEARHRSEPGFAARTQLALQPDDWPGVEMQRAMMPPSLGMHAQLKRVTPSTDPPTSEFLITVRKVPASSRDTGTQGEELDTAIRRFTTHHAGVNSQQVRILAGQQAFIHTGRRAASPDWLVIYPPYALIGGNRAPQEYGEGFYVTPQVDGDQVVLDVRHQHYGTHNSGDQTLRTSALAVRVRGRLSEWIHIGATRASPSVQAADSSVRITRTRRPKYIIEIKVEALDP